MRLGDSIMNCSLVHDQSALDIKCFGTIPQFCLTSTSSDMDVRVGRFVPLRITEEHGHIVLCDSFEETFLGKFIYVPNPCYLESWISGEARVLWVSNPNPRRYALVQMTSHPFDENKSDLSEVMDSKVFVTRSGPYKILEACTSGRGRRSSRIFRSFVLRITKRRLRWRNRFQTWMDVLRRSVEVKRTPELTGQKR